MKKTLLVSFAFLLLATQLMASLQDDIRLGEPEYGGTGCPAGSAGVALSPDAKAISILFDEFVVEAGGDTGRSLERKTCNIAVPVHVPQGISVSVFKIDYRGFNSLPYGAYSRFRVEYFFAGTQGPTYERQFNGRLEADYLLTNSLEATAVVWSECGKSVILRANTAMLVRTNSSQQQSYSSVDSADITAGLVFNIAWKRC
jgi:hypothetical protein